jgi:hypothetical protein
MKREQRYCASPDWSVGHTTGDGIPIGMCILGVHRVTPAFREIPFPSPLRYGELHGRIVSEVEHRGMLAEHGYLVSYFPKMWLTREQFAALARSRGRI